MTENVEYLILEHLKALSRVGYALRTFSGVWTMAGTLLRLQPVEAAKRN